MNAILVFIFEQPKEPLNKGKHQFLLMFNLFGSKPWTTLNPNIKRKRPLLYINGYKKARPSLIEHQPSFSLLTRRASLSGRKHYTDFFDPASASVRFLYFVYPTNKVPARDWREVLPCSLGRRCSREGFVKIHWDYRITARASLSGYKHRTGFLDPAFMCLRFLGPVYPTNKVPARDWRETLPHSHNLRGRGKSIAKIHWHFGL